MAKINFKNILFYLTVVALLSPFFIDKQAYFPFIIGKATVFRIIVGLMMVVWALWVFGKQDPGLEKNKKSLSLLVKAVIIFGIIIFISALFGVDFNYSFFSGNERMEGVLGIWYFIAFFLIITTTFKYLEIEKILKIQLGIGVFYSIVALLAYSGIGIITSQLTGGRLAGYTGNPSFFAVYLLFNAFLALYFYFHQYNFDKKLFNWWLIPFFIQSLLLFATLTRGSMVGYLISIILIALSIILLSKDKIILPFKKISIVFLIGIIAVSVFTFAGKNTDFVKNNKILSRFSSISLTDPTAKSRIFSAGVAWESFLQKPLFGWGQENYEAAYTTNFNPEVLKHLPEDFYFDRAHNKPMEVLATNGIFGFLSYLSIFAIAFYFLNKLRKKQEWFLPSLALGGCLVGYFIQNIFIFDFHESYLVFYLVLAFISSLGFNILTQQEDKDVLLKRDDRENVDNNAKTENKIYENGYASKMGKFFLIIVVTCFFVLSTSQWIIKPYFVSRGIIRTTYFMNKGQGEDSFKELRKIINNPTFFADDIVVGIKKADSSYGSRISEEERKKILESLIVLAEERVEKAPWRFGLVTAKADLETTLAQWDKNWLLEAQKSTEFILSKFPYFPQAHLFASKFYLMNGEIEKGKVEAEKTIELNPRLATSYYLLALAHNELENFEKRDENLIKAAELNYSFTDKNQILTIINLCAKEKKYEVIEKLYLRAIQIDPQDVSLYTSLAATYAKMQNKGKAIEYAKKAVELNPAIQESANEFIELVENEQWELVAD
jgi:O-antigen ligase